MFQLFGGVAQGRFDIDLLLLAKRYDFVAQHRVVQQQQLRLKHPRFLFSDLRPDLRLQRPEFHFRLDDRSFEFGNLLGQFAIDNCPTWNGHVFGAGANKSDASGNAGGRSHPQDHFYAFDLVIH